MPNLDHSIDCWEQMASYFKIYPQVLFDVFNEPYPDNNTVDSEEAWRCWRDGNVCKGMNFKAAGMQSLVDIIRSTNATNIIMLGGINYANSLTRWIEYKPRDSLNNLVASWHSYSFNTCIDKECWKNTVGKVAEKFPVVAGEIGESDCQGGYITPLMEWLDEININYLSWTWNTWDCDGGPALIIDYDGTPTKSYGMVYKQHLINN